MPAYTRQRMGDHITNIAEAIYYIIEGHEIEAERPKVDTTSAIKCGATAGEVASRTRR